MRNKFEVIEHGYVEDEVCLFELEYGGRSVVNIEVSDDGDVVIFASVPDADRVQVLEWT